METIYHLRVKKEHASRIIEELIQADAVEDLDKSPGFELSHLQEAALDAEMGKIEQDKNYLLEWDSVKGKFQKS